MAAKRKRSQPSLIDGLNPHSYPEETLKQFRVAGLDPTSDFPTSSIISLFPHRAIDSVRRRHGLAGDIDATNGATDDDDRATPANFDIDRSSPGIGTGMTYAIQGHEIDGDVLQEEEFKSLPPNSRGRLGGKGKERGADKGLGPRVRVLRAIIDRSLQTGKIERAKQTWAILLRTTGVGGRPIDLRDSDLWSLGAEILMRDGEVPDCTPNSPLPQEQDIIQASDQPREESKESKNTNNSNPFSQDPEVRPRRWGRPDNMPNVQAYYDSLSRTYPYSFGAVWRPSALDFEESKFACEIYNAQIEHRIASWKVNKELGQKPPPPPPPRVDTAADTSDIDNAGNARVGAQVLAEKNQLEEIQPESIEDDHHQSHYGDEGMDDDSDFRTYQEQYYDNVGMDHDGPPPNQEAGQQSAMPAEQEMSEPGYDSVAFNHAKDKVNATAIDTVVNIAMRMDHIMATHPYSNSYSLLRLRGMLALWNADLYIPSKFLASRGSSTLEGRMERLLVVDAEYERSQRDKELDVARQIFSKIKTMGGFVEPLYCRFSEPGHNIVLTPDELPGTPPSSP